METPVAKKRKLTAAAKKKFKEILLEQRFALVSSVSRMEDGTLRSSKAEVSVDHMADAGSDHFDQELNLGLLEGGAERLKEIDAALERLREGTFGFCENCDEPIGKARMDALPYAALCIACKSLEEQDAL